MESVTWFCFLFVLCFVGDVVLSEGVSEARISAIEKALRDQAKKLEEQSLDISQLKKTVISQNEEIADLKKTVLDLRLKQYGHQKDLSLLKSLIQRTNKRHDEDESIPTDGQTNDESVQDEQVSEKSAIKRESKLLDPLPTNRSGLPQSYIAFHAYLSHIEALPGPHHIIVFDSESLDLQNSYNIHNGMFTAPVPGIYAFFYSMRLSVDGSQSFELMKNSEVLEVIYVKSNDWSGSSSSGNNVAHLLTGDVVYIRTHSTFATITGSIYSDYVGRPHFSGYLIYHWQ